jgi:hypothetical protein
MINPLRGITGTTGRLGPKKDEKIFAMILYEYLLSLRLARHQGV